MRMSRLFGTTLRNAPGGAESEGYQLLLRAGFLRQLGQGIYSMLPLGLRSLRKIEAILRTEMEAIGGQELSMPVVHPADLWKASGRYYSIGPELARFHDRRGRDMVLAMTNEEVVAALSSTEIVSYRDLPRMVYQIQTKFRDDPRPRAGLVRVREFLMKDAYSLDTSADGLHRQYVAQYQAYFNVFARCGLPVVAVASDTGMMGGKVAHEFMYLTPVGEDTLLLCDGCGYAANREVAGFAKPRPPREERLPIERVATPQTATIAALTELLDVPADRTAKAVFVAVDREQVDGSIAAELILAVVRGDMDLNERKLASAVGGAEVRPMTEDEIYKIGSVPGYASPIDVTGATVVIDDLVAASPNLIAGANEAGFHLRNVNAGRDYSPDIVADIAAARAGDACVVCGAALGTSRGVEVGQTFKLGERYSEAIGAVFVDADGQRRPVVMGCYGIGVGRLLACVAEEHRDERGLRLPISVAPYQVYLCRLDGADSRSGKIADRLYDELSAAGVEVLYDDRGERPGVQFGDADLIGPPLRLVVGERALERGGVELRERTSVDSVVLPVDEVVAAVRERVTALLTAR